MTPAAEREARATIASEVPLDPNSLCGSYCLHDGEQFEQGLVVAEVQPGVYLIQFYDLLEDEPTYQRIVKVDDFTKVDDEGGRWRFYDSHVSAREGFKAMLR